MKRIKGGVRIGDGIAGVVYSKPPVESANAVEKKILVQCEWKDGYVAKVFGKLNSKASEEDKKREKAAWTRDANIEWEAAEKLRELKIPGMLYPETQCTLKDGRIVHFAPYGGKSVEQLFYITPTEDEIDEYFPDEPPPKPFRDNTNNQYFPGIINALKTLRGQVIELNKAGIRHMDLHSGNIVYDGKVASVIDFGYAVQQEPSGADEAMHIDVIIEQLEGLPAPTGGSKKSRRRAGKARRRTRRHRSSR